MSSSWPKVIRDPVHNIIAFEDTRLGQLLLDLVNCREFQRLRRIKQLGFSEIVFPGANHSRFAHSIGVMHTARLFLARILSLLPEGKITDDHKTIVLVAALLHDTGHGPFSHAFESVTGDKHEKRTRQIIEDESTEVHKRLKAFAQNLPQQVAAFFLEDPTGSSNGAMVPAYLTHVVSSQFDADRSDYLLRDSYAAGTDYGTFDLRWLLDHMYVDEDHACLFLGRKAFHGTEQYVFARYHMYQTVYFHKATRSAEVMLRLLFKRYKELLDGRETKDKPNVVPGTPLALVQAFSGALHLDDYLQLDDATITEFFKRCEVSEDSILKQLAAGLLNRRLYKCFDVTGVDHGSLREFEREAEKIVSAKINGWPVDYLLALDAPADTPYKVYEPVEDNPATQILIESKKGKPTPIDHESDQVNVLRKQITLQRIYFPVDVREELDKLATDKLKKGK